MRTALPVLALLVAIVSLASPAQSRDSFHVAVVKENTDAALPQTWLMSTAGEVRITNYRLQMIAIAYDSPLTQTSDQISGGPAWICSDPLTSR